MPTGECYRYTYRQRIWRTMSRYSRKQFYRENDRRKAFGLKELPKP